MKSAVRAATSDAIHPIHRPSPNQAPSPIQQDGANPSRGGANPIHGANPSRGGASPIRGENPSLDATTRQRA